MWREINPRSALIDAPGSDSDDFVATDAPPPAKSFAAAAWSVALADVSMSLDNVLAVAGAAKDHPGIMIVGLIFAVALMGIAANVIAQYIERYKWIAWFGMAVIVYVAGKMIYEGWTDPDLGVGRYVIAMIGG
jgi:predicted tellurium resistance membrane protein TerC